MNNRYLLIIILVNLFNIDQTYAVTNRYLFNALLIISKPFCCISKDNRNIDSIEEYSLYNQEEKDIQIKDTVKHTKNSLKDNDQDCRRLVRAMRYARISKKRPKLAHTLQRVDNFITRYKPEVLPANHEALKLAKSRKRFIN